MKGLVLVPGLCLALTAAAEGAPAAPRPEPRVTLRVKDAEVRDVIRSLRQQCGTRNVVIDDDVSGRASFYFSSVPCSTAWPVVLRTYGLTAASYSERIVHVERNR